VTTRKTPLNALISAVFALLGLSFPRLPTLTSGWPQWTNTKIITPGVGCTHVNMTIQKIACCAKFVDQQARRCQ